MRPWIKYSLLRLLVFGVILVALLLFGVNGYLAAIIAALAGLAISYIFFRRVRNEVALELANRRTRPEPTRDDLEEDALDASE